MADQLRTCDRTGCRWPAAASLTYRYDRRQVWLLDLAARSHPALYDLCPQHADSLVVPRGWDCADRRTAPPGAAAPQAPRVGGDSLVAAAPQAPRVGGDSLVAGAPQAPRVGGDSLVAAASQAPAAGGESLVAGPAGRDLAERWAPRPAPRLDRSEPAAAQARRPTNRYAALLSELPRIAATLGGPGGAQSAGIAARAQPLPETGVVS